MAAIPIPVELAQHGVFRALHEERATLTEVAALPSHQLLDVELARPNGKEVDSRRRRRVKDVPRPPSLDALEQRNLIDLEVDAQRSLQLLHVMRTKVGDEVDVIREARRPLQRGRHRPTEEVVDPDALEGLRDHHGDVIAVKRAHRSGRGP